jgi:non-canonical (house-cleaning) NTP pyrophosphatase
MSAARSTAFYAREVISVSTDVLQKSLHDVEASESILTALEGPKVPHFQPCPFLMSGNEILLVVPTENKRKRSIIEETARAQAPSNVAVHTVTVPVDSGVGEQPYNEAGEIGAYNRISNALDRIQGEEYASVFSDKRIGTVIVAAIENYIQTDRVERPVDYGVVVIHNATTQQTVSCVSCGVTVPPAYVGRARRFGFDGNRNHGRVTVGQILAAHISGLDKADWQKVLAGRSRYDILTQAIKSLQIPW